LWYNLFQEYVFYLPGLHALSTIDYTLLTLFSKTRYNDTTGGPYMKPEERYSIITSALQKNDPHNILDVEEVAKIAANSDEKPEKIIGVMLYVRYRITEKMSQAKAFELAFPERCVATKEDASATFGTTATIGEKLHRSTILVKAKRLEASPLYKKIFVILQTSLYVAYATDRLLILDEAFRISMSDRTPDRERHQYMKLFLEETRKPAEAAKMELNMNVTTNNVSVVDVESRMSDIATKLTGSTAKSIIEAVHRGNTES